MWGTTSVIGPLQCRGGEGVYMADGACGLWVEHIMITSKRGRGQWEGTLTSREARRKVRGVARVTGGGGVQIIAIYRTWSCTK